MIELTPVAWLHARMMHASRKGMTYFLRNSGSLILFPGEVGAVSAEASSISFSSTSACSIVRERSNAARAASLLPRRNNQRGDSDTRKLPITKRMPGGRETQNMERQALSLKTNSF